MIFLLPVLLPVIGGAILPLLRFESKREQRIYLEGLACFTSALILAACLGGAGEKSIALPMTSGLSLELKVDSLSRVFCVLIAFLWPLATLYGFQYMEHEENETRFFTFYLISYGVTAGIAMAANLFTLYVFYELLTLATLPLVLHKMDAPSVHAGRRYLYYSISGAALAFVGLMFLLAFGSGGTDFRLGGVLSERLTEAQIRMLRLVYVLTFVGFGAKAAIFPLHAWLPRVSVAPTPVTALLHAVAVVKAGAFAVIRMTYYGFGTEILRGTWAQNVVIGLAAFTIVYGSSMALREQHLKRRLAYSTVSNLSYILLGAALMSPAGMTGAMTHMLFHGLIKITLFFCAGAVLVRTGQEYIQDIRGFGKVMPFTMASFLFASAALVGVPPLPGFNSKWAIATACVDEGTVMGWVGMAALIVSAILTAAYLFPVAVNAYFRPLNEDLSGLRGTNMDPDWRMKMPIGLICLVIFALSFLASPLSGWLTGIAAGLY